MARSHVLVETVAGGMLLLASALARSQTCPPECPAPGEPIRPDKRNGCFVEFSGVPEARRGFKVSCRDGDPSCDADPAGDGCVFPVRVCINNVDGRFPKCTPEGIASIGLKGKRPTPQQASQLDALQDAIDDVVGRSPHLGTCSEPQAITVPFEVNRAGNRKKGVFKIRARTLGLGGTRSKDRLRLTCEPPKSPRLACPLNPAGGPNRLALTVGTGSDLDIGWTGISHNQGVPEGFTVIVCLDDCDLSKTSVCTGTGTTDTTGSPSINGRYFGPPLPLSRGGIPVCVLNEYRSDVALTRYDLATGEMHLIVRLTSKVHQGIRIDQPCPVCAGESAIGAAGTCDGGPGYRRNGRPCVVDGLTEFGNMSTDCLPDPANNIGDLDIDLPYTTESTILPGDAFECLSPPQGPGGPCPCPHQRYQNLCDSTCSEAECPSGLGPGMDQKCCRRNEQGRGCFEGDVRSQGVRGAPTPAWPDHTYPKTIDDTALAAPFCIAATESVIVNGVAGLAGPGHSILLASGVVELMRCKGGSSDGAPCGSDSPCAGGTCR